MLRLALLVALLGDGLLFGLARLERSAVYPFDATYVTPAQAGLPQVEERRLRSGGQVLILWVATPKPDRPTVLYFHGNAGNLANRAARFETLTQQGYGLIAPAYRGSSGSTGKPGERAITRDARTLWRQLGQIIPGLRPEQVVIYGESLGTGVALKLIAQPGMAQPGAVVLEAPFTSLPDVVRDTSPQLESLIKYMTNRWDSARHVRALRAPLLVLHGTEDRVIPLHHGQHILDAAGSDDKDILIVSGAGHSDLWRAETLPRLWHFINRVQADSMR